ncbi:Nuclear envelope pore membrane protein POM 121 [Galemys pyrenaicus]|uniref:Nuclear envelope pore membrane protein POM 121 n=1 Tax=Galemys pyrenaicus TaxID=202257 RepID=A0A8J6AKF8_GALPY|nr:Nuclear envelope pore membrane protein POM 121 [Galemys pyrenaicus]
MGGYLSRSRCRPPPPTQLAEDQRERPKHLCPAHPAGRVPLAERVHSHSAAPSQDQARKLDLVASPRRRLHRRRIVIVRRRQYPIQRARCLFLGVFSSVPWSGPQKKPVLSACGSKMFCTSVTLKMASARGKLTLCLALKQSVTCMWSSLAGHFPNTGVNETLLRTLEESGQRRAQEGKDLSGQDASGKVRAKQQEERPPSASARQDRQGRPSERSGGAQSAFMRLMVNGVLSSFVPRPGPLRRDICHKGLEDSLIKKSQIRFLSSCSKRNAITSSYSSTRGFFPRQRGHAGGGAGESLWDPPSPSPQEPAKKATEESDQPNSSTSGKPQRQVKHEKASDTTSEQKQCLKNCSLPADSSRPRKRKIPLLLPSRRNDPLILPLYPQLGYRITAEDLDLEKKVAIQWINKVLEG